MREDICWVPSDDPAVVDAFKAVCGTAPNGVLRACRRSGEGDDQLRRYDLYRAGGLVLKLTSPMEAQLYSSLLSGKALPVPAYMGSIPAGDRVWVAMEHVPGQELKAMSDTTAVLAAKSIAAVQNAFWQHPDPEIPGGGTRFRMYLERIERRAAFADADPLLGRAYRLFLSRQHHCPRTLCSGDMLQYNTIYDGSSVRLIDWGFGGILPYSLDIARFIAHATETGCTFPFIMTLQQKQLFARSLYGALLQKPDPQVYRRDIKLAVLNEYVEFVEAGEDEDGWYLEKAAELARDILELQA